MQTIITVEPITLVLAGAAVGALASKTVDKAIDLGSKWLAKKYEGHEENVRLAAKKNVEAFLIKLANRVDVLEKSSGEQKVTLSKIENVFDDPDFALTLQDAIISSSRTSEEDIHELLSRILEERIKSESNLTKLVLNEAVKTVSKLTVNQLKIITLLHLLKYTDLSKIDDELKMQVYLQFEVKPFLDISENITDYQHLQYAGCGYFDISIGLRAVMARKCPVLFIQDFVKSRIDYLKLPDDVKNELFYYNEERNIYRSKMPTRLDMKNYLENTSLDKDIKAQLRAMYEGATLNFGDFTLAIEKSCEEGKQLMELLRTSNVSTFSLTSIGMAIAIKYYEQITNRKLDFDSWFSEEFSKKITKKIEPAEPRAVYG